MKSPDHISLRAAVGAAALLFTLAAHAQDAPGEPNTDAATARHQAAEMARGDPPRWYVEDASTQARLRTLRKEIGAALQEARNGCRKLPAGERAACLKDAQATYQQDMAGARAQVMAEGAR